MYRARVIPAAMARTKGTPMDVELLERFETHRDFILDRVIAEVNKDFHVFEGREFKYDLLEQLLIRENIPWPVTATGRLDLRDETFEDLVETYPQFKPIRQVRKTLAGMRGRPEKVDKDGYARPFLNPLGSSTGRYQPSSKKYVWFKASWERGFVKPQEGYGLVHADYKSQEIGVAASISGDKNLQTAHRSGDAYYWFALKGELIPPETTRQAFEAQRPLFKTAFLAINYGMGAESLALRINRSVLFARQLIQQDHELFPDYWRWSDRAVDHAMLFGWQNTVFDWIHRLGPDPRPTALRNFPIQANGAEMLRLAHCLATENGISVCAPIHDALVIEAPLENLDRDIAKLQPYMAEASRVVLRGFELSTDVKVVRYPDRYMSAKGKPMWDLVMRLLEEIEAETAAAANISPALVSA